MIWYNISQDKSERKMSVELLDTEEAVEESNSCHEMKVSFISATHVSPLAFLKLSSLRNGRIMWRSIAVRRKTLPLTSRNCSQRERYS